LGNAFLRITTRIHFSVYKTQLGNGKRAYYDALNFVKLQLKFSEFLSK
jgi:hypothetical protein